MAAGRDAAAARLELKMTEGNIFDEKQLQSAFKRVEEEKPWLALWLFVFKDGDGAKRLPVLQRLFRQSAAAGARHGVFHWTSEFCDQGGGTVPAITQAYLPVSFVFMFGYLDERLAAHNKTKYMPFPLGPALLRGWKTPGEVLPTSKRKLLAAYRGSATTHLGLIEHMKKSVQLLGASERSRVVLEERQSWSRKDTGEDHARYLNLMANSRFAVSPAGHNPNTYRIAEAVESGSTPVIVLPWEKCYRNWAGLYGHVFPQATRYNWIPKAPFLVLQDWSQLGKELQVRLQDSKDETIALRHWYQAWREAFRMKLLEHVLAAR